jgi:GTPase SAR1 family protein
MTFASPLHTRCMVIGDNGTGKTCLSNKLCGLTGNAGGWMFGVAQFIVELEYRDISGSAKAKEKVKRGVKPKASAKNTGKELEMPKRRDNGVDVVERNEAKKMGEGDQKARDDSKSDYPHSLSTLHRRVCTQLAELTSTLSFAESGGPHRFFRLAVWDSNGSSDYDTIRIHDYQSIQSNGDGLDVVVIVFSLDSERSLESARCKWFAEAKFHAPSVRLILVGNKADLRKWEKNVSNNTNEHLDGEISPKADSPPSSLIPYSAGLALAQEYECAYFECCSEDQTQILSGIEDLMAHILVHPEEVALKKEKESCLVS